MAKIEIQEYNREWGDIFKEEAEELKAIFDESFVSVHHIGSTAVQGMAARPIIDILLVVKDISTVADCMSELKSEDYELDSFEEGSTKRFLYKNEKRGDEYVRTFNLYVVDAQCKKEIKSAVGFVKLLRRDDELASRYSDLKKKLAEENPEDEEAYLNGKAEIMSIVNKKVKDANIGESKHLSYGGIGACFCGTLGFYLGTVFGGGVIGLLIGLPVGFLLGVGLAAWLSYVKI